MPLWVWIALGAGAVYFISKKAAGGGSAPAGMWTISDEMLASQKADAAVAQQQNQPLKEAIAKFFTENADYGEIQPHEVEIVIRSDGAYQVFVKGGLMSEWNSYDALKQKYGVSGYDGYGEYIPTEG